ncbi:MAG: hypothetical protein ACK4N5_02670, partial [Myxococcales bacterium]
MATRCLLHVEEGVTADDYVRAAAGLLDAADRGDATPRLGIFGLAGDTILLGRHQRLASAIREEEARRAGLTVA